MLLQLMGTCALLFTPPPLPLDTLPAHQQHCLTQLFAACKDLILPSNSSITYSNTFNKHPINNSLATLQCSRYKHPINNSLATLQCSRYKHPINNSLATLQCSRYKHPINNSLATLQCSRYKHPINNSLATLQCSRYKHPINNSLATLQCSRYKHPINNSLATILAVKDCGDTYFVGCGSRQFFSLIKMTPCREFILVGTEVMRCVTPAGNWTPTLNVSCVRGKERRSLKYIFLMHFVALFVCVYSRDVTAILQNVSTPPL